MSEIRDYSTQISADAPGEGRRIEQGRPQDFGAGVGTAIGQIGGALDSDAKVLYDVSQRQEVSDVHAKLAAARAQWTTEFANRAAAAAAGDTAFIDKFQGDVSSYLNDMGGNYSTRAGQEAFQQGAADLSSHFVESGGLYAVHSAGVKAVQDYQTILNANRSTLFQDPTQFDSVLKSTTDALNDPNGPYARMPPDKRAELARTTQEQLAFSALQGMVRIDPQEAKKEWDSGKWSQYIDAGNDWKATSEINSGIRGQQMDAERARIADEKAKTANEDKIGHDFLSRLQPDSENPLTAKEILASPTRTPFQEHWMSLLDRSVKPDPLSKVSAATANGLFADMHREDSDPLKLTTTKEIDQKYIDGDLNRTDHDWLIQQFSDLRDDQGARLGKRQSEFLGSFKASIDKSNPLMGATDPTGQQNFYQFSRYVADKVQQYRQGGENPYDLFDPSKPDYIGKPETVQMFQKTTKQSIEYMQQQMARQVGATGPGGAVAPENQRKPGESVAAYLARTGAK